MNAALIIALFAAQIALVVANCSNNNGGCKMLCNPQSTGYTCSCFNGYTLADNGLNCLDCTVRSRLVNVQSLAVVANSNQVACETQCSTTNGCSASGLNRFDTCVLYASPIIAVAYDVTQQQCISECSQKSDCLTLNYGTSGDCYLFNEPYGSIPSTSGWSIRTDGSYTIIEKGICPNVL